MTLVTHVFFQWHDFLHNHTDNCSHSAGTSSHLSHSPSSPNHSLLLPCIYKHEQTNLRTVACLMADHLHRRITPLCKQLQDPSAAQPLALRAFLHQQYDHITTCVPQLFYPSPLSTMRCHTLVVDIINSFRGTQRRVHIAVPSLDHTSIRYTLANTLHLPADSMDLHIHESARKVQCTLASACRRRLSMRVVFVNNRGRLLFRTQTVLHTHQPLTTTLFSIVHLPRVRQWLYTTNQRYPYITPFLHTQLLTLHSLSHHTHLQPNDTLYCIMTTHEEHNHIHSCIDSWVNTLQQRGHVSLGHLHRIRKQLYRERRTTVPATAKLNLSAFHQHVWHQWVQQLSFVYTIHRLHKNKQLKRWLALHSTLLADALWNDYAYHTNHVFDRCAQACILREIQQWKYTMDHWDIISLSLCRNSSHNKHYIIQTITNKYTKHTAANKAHDAL